LDVATRLASTSGGAVDLTSTAIQLGKALNDPIANLGALGRTGIQFSQRQKDVIKALAESNRLAEAQSIILKELKTQYGGAARAAAKAGTGPIKQLFNLLGDLVEDLGKIFGEALIPYVPIIKAFIDNTRKWVSENKELVKTITKFALILSGLLSTFLLVGTALKIFAFALSGFSNLSFILAGIKSVLAGISLLTPFGWLAAAVALVVILEKKFNIIQKIADMLVPKFEKIGDFLNEKLKPGLDKLKIGNPFSGLGINQSDESDITKIQKNMNIFGHQKVDVNGLLRVQAEQGSRVTYAKFNQPNLGVNIPFAQ
jgi:hypothetical protein